LHDGYHIFRCQMFAGITNIIQYRVDW
jgi:hypothetical protein